MFFFPIDPLRRRDTQTYASSTSRLTKPTQLRNVYVRHPKKTNCDQKILEIDVVTTCKMRIPAGELQINSENLKKNVPKIFSDHWGQSHRTHCPRPKSV